MHTHQYIHRSRKTEQSQTSPVYLALVHLLRRMTELGSPLLVSLLISNLPQTLKLGLIKTQRKLWYLL